jgi:hypothetical protein
MAHAWDVEIDGECDDVVRYLCAELDWKVDGAGGGASLEVVPAEPTPKQEEEGAVAPRRFCVLSPARTNGAAGGNGAGAGKAAAEQAQTALYEQPTHPAQRGQRRLPTSGLMGATLAGSGVGARGSLGVSAPIAPPPTSSGKRPVTSDGTEASAKRSAPSEAAADANGGSSSRA